MWILAGFFILMAIAVVLILRNMKIKQMEEENLLMQAYMKSIEDSYSAIQDRIEAVRKYRHDLAKHIQTLEHILEQGAAEDKQGNTEEKTDGQIQNERYCSDEIVNSVLCEKMKRCKALEIPLVARAEDASYHNVRELDMAAILHNLLDNAIEANERIPVTEKRGIFLEMGMEEEIIWIELNNYLCPGAEVTFETKKEHREDHGFGMRIIEELIEKYNGKSECHLDEKEHTLNQKIYLSVPDSIKNTPGT